MPVVAAIPYVVAAVSAGATVYGMAQQRSAAKDAIASNERVAAYNSAVDLADAKQIELDADENLRTDRHDAQIYLSRMEAAYAASGVLNSGSPLAAQATAAGKLEQNALQNRLYAQREAEKHRKAAEVGMLYSSARSDAIRTNSRIETLRGGVSLLSTANEAYRSGLFSF